MTYLNPTIHEHLIDRLERAIGYAKMTNMSLGFPPERVQVLNHHHHAAAEPVHPTDYVKDITKLYRETWLIPPLVEALRIIQAQKELLTRIEYLASALHPKTLDEIAKLASAGLGEFTTPPTEHNSN